MKEKQVNEVAVEMQSLFPGLIINTFTYSDLFDRLSDRLNSMINEDFSGLLKLLYRIDISESKLRDLVKAESEQPASEIIAHLIIERQHQKILTRELFKPSNDIPEDEKW